MGQRPRLLILTVPLWLASCASVPPPAAAPVLLDPQRIGAQPASAKPAADAWWTALSDPVLDRLIASALRDSPNLRAAKARLFQAQAALEATDAPRAVQVNADGSIDRERETGTGTIPPPFRGATITNARASVSASYDFDLFGRSAAAVSGAASNLAAARADQAYAAAALAAAVTQAYLAWRGDLARREVALQVSELRGQLQQVARSRQQRGLDAGAPRRQSDSDRAQSRANLAAIDLQIGLDRDALSALTLVAPDALPEVLPALPDVELPEPQRLELDALSRRADITAARLRVESASLSAEAARLQFYPSVNLSAAVGLTSVQPGDFFRGQSRFWNVGPAVHLPIFDGGRLRANLRASQAQLDGAVAAYDQAVVNAAQEVLDQIKLLRGLRLQLRELGDAIAASQRIAAIARQRTDAGLADRASVLQAQLSLLSLSDQRLQLQSRISLTLVSLARASGAGVGDEAWKLTEVRRDD